MQLIKRNEIRQRIYQLINVTECKKFRELFPEFANYSLQLKVDLKTILGCLETEPEAVAAVIALRAKTVRKVVSLPDYKFNKKLAACQNTESYVELMSDLNQEIVNECREYAQYFRSKKL